MDPLPRTIAPFAFTDLNGRQACCRIDLLPLGDGRALVMATELAGNTGMSITNAAEALAAAVCERLGIDPQRMVWIEHYDRGSYLDGDGSESFHRVRFHSMRGGARPVLKDPQWSVMADADRRTLGLASNPFAAKKGAIRYERRGES